MENYNFKLTSNLHISDPSLVSLDDIADITALHILNCRHGNWICDVYTEGMGERVGKAIAMHKDHVLNDEWVPVGSIGVDTGMCGFYDSERLYKIDPDTFYDEVCSIMVGNAMIAYEDLGVVIHSGFGDGIYEVRKQLSGGEVVAVEIIFITDKERSLI